jgi:hypothetical protein
MPDTAADSGTTSDFAIESLFDSVARMSEIQAQP